MLLWTLSFTAPGKSVLDEFLGLFFVCYWDKWLSVCWYNFNVGLL